MQCHASRGHGRFGSVLEVDQTPIGRTPRSTPGTYVGFFDDIRKLFTQTSDARMRISSRSFFLQQQSGRCPACEGMGAIKMEISFCRLPTRDVKPAKVVDSIYKPWMRYKGKNIAEVMHLSVAEALPLKLCQNSARLGGTARHRFGLSQTRTDQSDPQRW